MKWFVYVVTGRCGRGSYECDSMCVTSAQLCDGVAQCSDGSDEDWRAECPTSATTGSLHYIFLFFSNR